MMDWDSTRIVFTKRTLIEFLRYVTSLFTISRSELEVCVVGTLAPPSTRTLATSRSYLVRSSSFVPRVTHLITLRSTNRVRDLR